MWFVQNVPMNGKSLKYAQSAKLEVKGKERWRLALISLRDRGENGIDGLLRSVLRKEKKWKNRKGLRDQKEEDLDDLT